MIELSYFTFIFLWVKPFLYYQSQGHLSRPRSNIKVTVFLRNSCCGGNSYWDLGRFSPTRSICSQSCSLDFFLYLAPYSLANQKLCYIQIYKILGKKTKNILENGWWILNTQPVLIICWNDVQRWERTNPFSSNVIYLLTESWRSRGWNLQPPVLKSCMLPI